MENYIDSSFAVTDKTIITYTGQDSIVRIPSRFADIEVSTIGNGSFMESKKMQCVIVPPKIKKIGIKAFAECESLNSVFIPGKLEEIGVGAFNNSYNLRDIIIYDLELTKEEYQSFKGLGKRSDEGIYVLHEMPENELIKKIVIAHSDAKPICRVPSGISSLFYLVELDEKKGKFSLDKNIPVIGFNVPSEPITENNAFMRHIKNNFPEVYIGKTEEKNDSYARVNTVPLREKTILVTFDDMKTVFKKGKYLLQVTLKIGHFFWQSAQPVIYENKKYYVYRRYYLTSNPELEQIRRDIAIYDGNGVVNDRKEAQNVYAKYKLLSIL